MAPTAAPHEVDPNSDDFTEDQIIAAFSRKEYPRFGITGRLQAPPPDVFSISHSRAPSSVGTLDRLPTELQFMVVSLLDACTARSFSWTSLRAHALLESTLAWADLRRHAPKVLAVHCQERALLAHPLRDLHAALLSDRCAFCALFGAYLFLPTCLRACLACLTLNPALWTLSAHEAELCFGLAPDEASALPAFRIPRLRRICTALFCASYNDEERLVRAADARDLAERLGREASKTRVVRGREVPFHRDIVVFARPGPMGFDPLCQPRPDGRGIFNECPCQAIMVLPSLVTRQPEGGLWCRGCLWMSRQEKPYPSAWMPATGRFLAQKSYLTGLSHRERTRAEFLRHVKVCPGVQTIKNNAALMEMRESRPQLPLRLIFEPR